MLIILSQKVDSESTYSDELFRSYHYPARYRNQLHEGDIFIYYQGNRYDKSQRYYFGVGKIGEVYTRDGENYYATLMDCKKFARKVPIYLQDGGHIEQLGYETVRKRITPPWQSSVRPLSQQAFDFILNAAGMQYSSEPEESLDVLKERLKHAVRDYYVDGDDSAILRIGGIASSIAHASNIAVYNDKTEPDIETTSQPSKTSTDEMSPLIEYCKGMKMTYSYKPLLILALLEKGDDSGRLHIDTAVQYFRKFYTDRRNRGLRVEKKPCIYQKPDVSDEKIAANLIDNPIRALTGSGYFSFDAETFIFSVLPEVWNAMDNKSMEQIKKNCAKKLKNYYLGGIGR